MPPTAPNVTDDADRLAAVNKLGASLF